MNSRLCNNNNDDDDDDDDDDKNRPYLCSTMKQSNNGCETLQGSNRSKLKMLMI